MVVPPQFRIVALNHLHCQASAWELKATEVTSAVVVNMIARDFHDELLRLGQDSRREFAQCLGHVLTSARLKSFRFGELK